MIVRPPQLPATKLWTSNSAAALEYEIAQEKASALGRLGRALEAALDRLREFDAQHAETTTDLRGKRKALVAEAGRALWLFVVQRECIGVRDTRALMREYRVPGEVQNRMGAF